MSTLVRRCRIQRCRDIEAPGGAENALPYFPPFHFWLYRIFQSRIFSPQDSMTTLAIVYRTKLTADHSVHNFQRKHWENSPCDSVHSDWMAVL